jgi:hypothetical protein
MVAQIEGDFVVFLIGMRINKPWNVPATDLAGTWTARRTGTIVDRGV